MTKDWDSVEAEIRELYAKSNGKITLGEIEKLMARKKFRASTRAYRMKLKEWGLLKQKSRREQRDRSSSETVEPSTIPEPMSLDVDDGPSPEEEVVLAEPTLSDHCTERGGWQVVEDLTITEPTFMGLLHQAPM